MVSEIDFPYFITSSNLSNSNNIVSYARRIINDKSIFVLSTRSEIFLLSISSTLFYSAFIYITYLIKELSNFFDRLNSEKFSTSLNYWKSFLLKSSLSTFSFRFLIVTFNYFLTLNVNFFLLANPSLSRTFLISFKFFYFEKRNYINIYPTMIIKLCFFV